MAEQEVIKHTKNIFSLWGTKEKFWHKVREFLLEIFIIVFAISLSIYLHDRSVLQHQRHETKEFLLGLKQDLTTDMAEMEEDKKSFSLSGKAFAYIINRKMNEPLNKDTIKYYYRWMYNITSLVPNNGRFEGFKSAGKIGTIENTALQNDIMDLYQEDVPNIQLSTDAYTMRKQRFFDYTNTNRKRLTDSTTNISTLLASDEVYNLSVSLSYAFEIIERYDLCIAKMKKIVAAINKEYEE